MPQVFLLRHSQKAFASGGGLQQCCILSLTDTSIYRVTEQPYKIPFYAAVLRHLYEPTGVEETPPVGRMILEEFAKGFRAFLDKLAWRETRLCVSDELRDMFWRLNRIFRFTFLHTSPLQESSLPLPCLPLFSLSLLC
jgi:hypothetical protein